MLVGMTHTRYSADAWNDPGSVAGAQRVLRSFAFQNQFIMGWGVQNPEPSPGVYDWSGLDERVDLMRRSGRPMVLTLCCAPDWMKGGQPGQTDWSRIDKAPTPAHYADFADLCAQIARRYPDVHYFQVWSELRGFFDRSTNRWNAPAYTQFYNQVYTALKGVNPLLDVGGPYVHIDTWESPGAGGYPSDLKGTWGVVDARPLEVLSYWLAHKVGADFVSVDGGLGTRDGPPVAADVAVKKLVAVDGWLTAHTDLPIWWSEVHVEPSSPTEDDQTMAADTVTALDALATSGAHVALLWCGERCGPADADPGLWTPTDVPGGGNATAITQALLHDPYLGRI